MEKLTPNRILYLDYARTIALFLVVFAHLYSVDSKIKLYIYAFHMPFFFLVSGILHRSTDYIPLFEKMVKRMLIPFCFFLFIGYLFFVVSSRSISFDILLKSAKGIILGIDITANDILWFLIALFWVRIIGNWFVLTPMMALPVIIITSFLAFSLHKNYFYLGTSLMALPFYLFGYYARSFIHKIITNNWHLLLSLLLFACTVYISNYNGKVSMMGCSFGKASLFLLRYILFYVNGLVGSIAILCLMGGVKVNLSWLMKPSNCAISIVGLQFIPVMIWYRTIGFNHNFMISSIYSLLIIMGCVLFHLFVAKHANWLLGGK